MQPRPILAALVLCLAGDNSVTAQEQGPPRGGPPRGGGPRQGGFPGFGPQEPVDWAARRKELTSRFDADKDGLLSEAEREAMRVDRFKTAFEESRAGRNQGFMMPPEVVKKYDKDGDGQLNEEESMASREGMRRQLEEINKKYDRNTNGRLDPEEQEAVRKDIDAGVIEGIPRFFFMGGPGRGPGRGGGGGRGFGADADPSRVKVFDADGNGRLSAEELAKARAGAGVGGK